MDVKGLGYSECKNIFSKSIELSVVGIAKDFILEVHNRRAHKGTRYMLNTYLVQYRWIDRNNGAIIECGIGVTYTDSKYFVEMEFNTSPGLPCKFVYEWMDEVTNGNVLWELYHKGANPENAIIQGIYGRLVDHTDALDYKDLDYV